MRLKDLNNKSLEAAMALLTETEEYINYRKALSTADNASPYEIPKADGELKFADKQLRLRMELAGISSEYIPQLIHAIKARLHG